MIEENTLTKVYTVIPGTFKHTANLLFQKSQNFLYLSLYFKRNREFETESGKFKIISIISREKCKKIGKNTLQQDIKRN